MSKSKEKSIPVKVVVRVRPINEAEICRGSRMIVDCPPNKREIIVNERPSDKITRKFTFDRVFGPEAEQIDIYNGAASPLIQEVLSGYNCTIFAYGQTGAGKTYTMEGRRSVNQSVIWTTDRHAGIIPRAVGHLFDELRLLQAEFSVKASFLEIYNEEIFDLLSPIDDSGKLRLYEDAGKKGSVFVNGLDEIAVTNKEAVYAILDRGSRKRQTAATLMNASSSRSHTVFSITVRIKENGVEDDEMLRTGKLNFVDLAGSENIGRSGAVEKRAREAGNINQSLLTLGRVITALVEKTPHVPYRESKLTRLLQESLGGRTKTCIIATISPSYCNLEETLSTLDYAHRAKNIQNKPEVNLKIGKVTLIQDYIQEIQQLKADLTAAREKNGVYIAEENYNGMMLQIERQKQELTELLGSMKTLNETAERKEELNRELSESLEKYLEELQQTKTSLDETEVLLQHHVVTENMLSKQADDLLFVADAATNDVHLLHESLLRKRNIEENNMRAFRNVAALSKHKLYNIQEKVSYFKNCELKTNQELMNIIGGTKERTELRTQKMKDDVNKALNTSAIILKNIQDSARSMVSQAGKIVDDTKVESSATLEVNKEVLLNFMNDVIQKVEQVSREMSQFETEQNKITDSIMLKVKEQEKEMKQFFESTNLQIHNIRNNVEKQEKIIATSTQTFRSVLRSAIATLDGEVHNLESSLATCELTASNLQTLETEMYREEQKSEAYETDIQTLLEAGREMVNPVVNKIKSVNSKICEGITEQKSRFSDNQKQYLDGFQNNLDSVSKILVDYQSNQLHKTEELLDHTNEVSDVHKESLDQNKMEQIISFEECMNLISSDNEYIKSSSQSTSEEILECVNMIENFATEKVMDDVPSGRTPQRREFNYPREMAATSPHERILSRFRAAKIEEALVDQAINSTANASERLQDSSADSNSSSLESSQMSANDMRHPIGKCPSKSTSDIYAKTARFSVPSKSEPSIPNALLDKENSSVVSLSGVKQNITKRQVLTQHNE